MQPLRKEVERYQAEIDSWQARYNQAIVDEAASIIQADERALSRQEHTVEYIDPEWSDEDEYGMHLAGLEHLVFKSHNLIQTMAKNNVNYSAGRITEISEEIGQYIDRCPKKEPTVAREKLGLFGKHVLMCSSNILPSVYVELPDTSE